MKTSNTLPLLFLSVLMTSCGGGGSDTTATPPPTPANLAPTANAATDQSVNEQSTVSLSGSGTDSDGSIANYSWSQISGESVSLSDQTSNTPTFTAPTLTTATSLSFELTVTDNEGATAKDSVDIVINPVNEAPIANAGSDQSVNEQSTVTLSGSGTDLDGGIASYNWSQVSGYLVTLSNTSDTNVSFTAPAVHSDEELFFELTVTDNENSIDTNQVKITVKNMDSSFAIESSYSELPLPNSFININGINNIDIDFDNLNDLIIFHTVDIAAGESGAAIQALINNGDGTFSDKTTAYLKSTEGWLNEYVSVSDSFILDLNNDGLEDIISASNAQILLHKEDGTFDVYQQEHIGDCTDCSLFPIDMDTDGDIDLLKIHNRLNWEVDNELITDIYLLDNVSANNELNYSYQATPIYNNNLAENDIFIADLVAIDINNDTYLDLVFGGPKWNEKWFDERVPIHALKNTGEKTFIAAESEFFPNGIPMFTHLRDLSLGQLDGTDVQSIIVANHGYDEPDYLGENNAVLRNYGEGKLVEEVGDDDTHDYKGFTHSLAVKDINNDGFDDIVYVDMSGEDVPDPQNLVRILINDKNGGFTNQNFVISESITAPFWLTCHLTDLNNDGYPELIVGAFTSASKNIIFWNDGAGNFSSINP
jgi:hypothetical protein